MSFGVEDDSIKVQCRARLEQEIDVPGVTQEQIDAAREEVSRNMSW